MLSHKVLVRDRLDEASRYYLDGMDDYYSKEGEAQAWQGKGAEALGLEGEVTTADFRNLLGGFIDPTAPSVRASTRDDMHDRIGIDLTFSAPKSVSILALVGGKSELIAMHDQAVTHALNEAEKLAQARQSVGGKVKIENTANLIVAKFRHETTRAADPLLHTHSVVLNLTQRADGSWRALKNDQIVKSSKLLGAIYRSELARQLTAAGYEIRHEPNGLFELASVTREQVAAFSQRSADIEDHLADMGVDRANSTTAQRQAATMATREAKDPTLDRAALHQEWVTRAQAVGLNLSPRLSRVAAQNSISGPNSPPSFAMTEASDAAVRFAIAHLSERDAVIDRPSLMTQAALAAIGTTSPASIEAAIAAQVERGRLVAEATRYRPADQPKATPMTEQQLVGRYAAAAGGEVAARAKVQAAVADGGLVAAPQRYTTSVARAREVRLLAIERDGRGAVAPVLAPTKAAAFFATTSLNDGQREAAVLMASTSDRVVGVEGLAGTGKSFMLEQAKARIEAEGYQVRALAPYGSQVKALRELGVSANTLASFLAAKDKGIDAKTVLVLDEAGVVPARQMADLLKIVEDHGARIVVMGDRMQTRAIEAGRPFEQLVDAGMKTARMDEIQRQRDPTLRNAVELAAKGRAVAALHTLPAVTEIANAGERHQAVAAAFLALSAEERQQTLIVTGTNEARRAINQHVREGLGLIGAGRSYESLARVDTTQAERKSARTYQVGQIVQPEKDNSRAGLSRHELYEVREIGPGNILTVSARDGTLRTFSPAKATLSVYDAQQREFSAGDSVRVTRNDAARDLANGDRYTVAVVQATSVLITDGKRQVALPTSEPLHLDHAYASTVHAAQGLTRDRTFYDAPSESLTTTRDVFYVALSRARDDFQLWTDNRTRLPEAVARKADKRAAMDIHLPAATRSPALERVAGAAAGRKQLAAGAELGD